MKAVRPHGDSTRGEGLSQIGDTADGSVLAPVVEEMEEESGGEEDRAPDVAAGGSDSQASLEPVEAEEEGEVVRIRRAPKGPTRREREEHEATHIPYREWCPHCVRGRGTNRPHRRGKEQDEDVRAQRVPGSAWTTSLWDKAGRGRVTIPCWS